MNINQGHKKVLTTRLISSAISWRYLLVNAKNGSMLVQMKKDFMGAAICCVELTMIELSLKALLTLKGSSEKELMGLSHTLSSIYALIEEDKKYIEAHCGYDGDKIVHELKNIDKFSNGIVNWRYLNFVDNLNSPSTKCHFCNTFIEAFAFSCCEVAEDRCGVKYGKNINIANPRRKS